MYLKHGRLTKACVAQHYLTSQTVEDATISLLMKLNILYLKVHKCINQALSADECYEDAMCGFENLFEHLGNVMNKAKTVYNDNCNESAQIKVLHSTNENEHDDVILTYHELFRAKGSARGIISGIHQTKLMRSCATRG